MARGRIRIDFADVNSEIGLRDQEWLGACERQRSLHWDIFSKLVVPRTSTPLESVVEMRPTSRIPVFSERGIVSAELVKNAYHLTAERLHHVIKATWEATRTRNQHKAAS